MFFFQKVLRKKLGKCILLMISALSLLFLSGCIEQSTEHSVVRKKKITFAPSTVIKVAYYGKENTPIDISMKRWKTELEKRSYGTMTLELYPNDELGTPEDILRRIAAGEPIATITGGSYFYSLGMKDMGIVGSPYLFNNWDEAFRLASSNWYKTEIRKLAKETNLRVISTNWALGVVHIFSSRPMAGPADFDGLRVALPDNYLQKRSYEIVGAKPVNLYSNQIAGAFDRKEVDATEGTILGLFNSGVYKKTPYLLQTGHIYQFGNVVMNEQFWQSLDGGQQSLIIRSCNRAGRFYNTVQAAFEYTALEQMKKEGLTVTPLSVSFSRAIHQKAREFFNLPDLKKSWSTGLYFKVMGTKTKSLTREEILGITEDQDENLNDLNTVPDY